VGARSAGSTQLRTSMTTWGGPGNEVRDSGGDVIHSEATDGLAKPGFVETDLPLVSMEPG
jgi:hypothetical protein